MIEPGDEDSDPGQEGQSEDEDILSCFDGSGSDNDGPGGDESGHSHAIAVSAVRDNIYLEDDEEAAGFTSESEHLDDDWMDDLDGEENISGEQDANPSGPGPSDPSDPTAGPGASDVAASAEHGTDGAEEHVPRHGDGDADAADVAGDVPDAVDAESSARPDESGAPAESVTRTSTTSRQMNPEQIVVPNYGSLRFYPKTKHITAHCDIHRHDLDVDCRKNRTVMESTARSRAGQGRPIGLLTAWLMDPDSHSCVTGALARQGVPSHDKRVAGRRHFLQIPGADQFVKYERERRPSEPEEPLSIP